MPPHLTLSSANVNDYSDDDDSWLFLHVMEENEQPSLVPRISPTVLFADVGVPNLAVRKFQRMFKIIKKGHDISLNDLSKPLVDCFKSVLRRYKTDSKTHLDLTKAISSRQFNGFISRISDAETQAVCEFLDHQLSEMKDSELRTPSAVKDDVNLMTTLITVNNRVMDKPLTLTDISRINEMLRHR
ncbi:Hypothetical predicted protein [Xyrichtys novacula]|uniref:Uncharacterized protein n=1 Tax=Xyrichtys novacula TaxID=13765 RepID=A0AAV1FV25_XYRNO|nr:Hypothetical predicted protein [Xyrichtys novacula]